MKKTLVFSAIAALGIFASCNTLQPEVLVTPEPAGTEVLLTVNDALWTGDTKTAYDPASGVGLTGDELISLYYKDDESKYQGNIKASPTGTPGQYSFTIPEGASGQTHWYGLMPYSSLVNGYSSGNASVLVRLGPVQFPGANTFDPHADFLVAQPFDVSGTPGSESGTISSFKRLFAPLCLEVSGLESTDKIYTATLSFSQAASPSSALAGVFFLTMDDSYAGTFAGTGNDLCGNAVSAEYATGLEAVAGSWPVWLMVNPITIASGGDITLSVSTADKTYTRTVTLPSALEIGRDKLNRLRFNIKGSGYTELESITQDFTAQTLTGSQSLTASDGSSISWTSNINKTFDDDGSGIAGAMVANGQSFTFPTIPGKNIVGARIFCHPASRYGGGAATSTLTVDGTVYQFNLASYGEDAGMCAKGGALDIALPAGKTSLSGISVSPSSQGNLISAITLFTEDAPIAPVNPNDYYALYEAGEDITINGTVFNKATNGAARCLKLYEMSNGNALVANYSANGILFLDYDEADGQEDILTLGNRLQPQGVVIIGRYRDHQPHIDLASLGTVGIESKGSEIHLKNVAVSLGNRINTANLTGSYLDLSIEDCTINACNDDLFYENKAEGFRNIVINNSVIKVQKRIYNSSIAAGSDLSISKFWITNSVVYSTAALSNPVMNISSWGTPSVDFKLENNTFFNLASNKAVFYLKNATKLNVNYCVGEAALSNKKSLIVSLLAALDPTISGSSVSNNYFNDNTTPSKGWTLSPVELTNSGVTCASNTSANQATPFTSTDTATGYFPINTTVVTNGAGADYSTKLWRTWE